MSSKDVLSFNQFRRQLLLEQEDLLNTTALSTDASVPPLATDMSIPAPSSDPLGLSQFDAPLDQTMPLNDPLQSADDTVSQEDRTVSFIFIQDANHKKWYGIPDKDGGIKRFTVFDIEMEELDAWITKNEFDSVKELVKDSLAGKKNMPTKVYTKFKRDVEKGILGLDNGLINITFDSETDFSNPATDDLTIVFLKSKNDT